MKSRIPVAPTDAVGTCSECGDTAVFVATSEGTEYRLCEEHEYDLFLKADDELLAELSRVSSRAQQAFENRLRFLDRKKHDEALLTQLVASLISNPEYLNSDGRPEFYPVNNKTGERNYRAVEIAVSILDHIRREAEETACDHS